MVWGCMLSGRPAMLITLGGAGLCGLSEVLSPAGSCACLELQENAKKAISVKAMNSDLIMKIQFTR
jgi:hypothetical protein